MSLKFRYATFLLIIFCVIALFSFAIVQAVLIKQYIVAIILTALLYATTFLAGKRLQKVFFTLSVIKFLRSRGGTASAEAIQAHVNKAVRGNSSIAGEIISLLSKEKVIEVHNKTVILTDQY